MLVPVVCVMPVVPDVARVGWRPFECDMPVVGRSAHSMSAVSAD